MKLRGRFMSGLVGLALLIFICTQAWSVQVQSKDAKRVAFNWMMKVSGRPSLALRISGIRSEMRDGVCVYYLVNFSPAGYVIVSADDTCHPILGYSPDTNFALHEVDEPPALRWLMKRRSEENYHIIRDRVTQSYQGGRLWRELLVDPRKFEILQRSAVLGGPSVTSISPLLATSWDQGRWYNEQCPADSQGPGGHVYAGCVATAMAQVLKKWNYPATGSGIHTYDHPTYGFQTANYGLTTYTWSGMPNSISGSNLEIARLLYHCGVAVNMGYGPSGSGAYSSDVPEALISHFRYGRSTMIAYKSGFPTDDSWDAVLRGELDNGRPVYYSGDDGTNGHAWNIDGYQYSDYFHCNWGWSGSSNGYFYLQSSSPLIFFPSRQAMVFRILPSGQLPDPYLYNSDVPASIVLGSSFDLDITSWNNGSLSDEGDITVSFPGMSASGDGPYVEFVDYASGSVCSKYERGQSIFHKNGYGLTAQYLMVNMVHPSWAANSTKGLSLRVTPKALGTFEVYVRSAMGFKHAYANSPATSSYADQQGWEVKRYTVNVVSAPSTYSLIVQTSPDSGATVTMSPTDINGQGAGTTTFTRTYSSGTTANLTAPATYNGKAFQYWKVDGGSNQTTQPIGVAMETNHAAVAYYASAISLAEALDNTALTFTTGGSAAWFGQTADSFYGGDAAQSGTIGDNQESYFETIVTGPGDLSFYWKVSSEYSFDFLSFYIDGVLQGSAITGDVDWAQQNYLISPGTHTLKWRYTKDVSYAQGSDAGWVDWVEYIPASVRTLTVQSSPDSGATITVSPTDLNGQGAGATTFTRIFSSGLTVNLTAPTSYNGKTFQYWKVDEGANQTTQAISIAMGTDHTAVAYYLAPPSTYILTLQSLPDSGATVTVSPTDINGQGTGTTTFTRTYNSGTTVNLTAPATYNGKAFQHWKVDGGSNQATQPISVAMGTNHAAVAYYASAISLAEALDNTALTFTTGGSAAWFGQTADSFYGGDAAQSGTIGDNQESYFETSVNGPGALSFYWKVSSESGWDFLEFYIDSVLQEGRITGDHNWAQQSYQIPAGTHTFRWRYTKDGSFAVGSDAGWVDRMEYVPASTCTLTAQSLPDSGATITVSPTDINGQGTGPTTLTRTYNSGATVSLTAPTSYNGKVFQYWKVDGGSNQTTQPISVTMGTNHTAVAYYDSDISLAEAVDNTALTFTTGGSAAWYGQKGISIIGGDAAQSGAIADGQESYLETSVSGPGALSFYWKVSSEFGWDYLEFYVDGVLQDGRITGEVDWAQQSYQIPAGAHTLRWRYVKDLSTAAGSDAGWVDGVAYVSNFSLAAPKTGDRWLRGQTYTISWAKGTSTSSYVKIQLFKGTMLISTIAWATDNDGSYPWTIPVSLGVASNYRIKIMTTDRRNSAFSGYFSITKPSITITSPGAGAVWPRSSTQIITWTKIGTQNASVSIQLFKGTLKVRDIALNVPNSGSHNWTLPDRMIVGTDYRIKIKTIDNAVKTTSPRFRIT